MRDGYPNRSDRAAWRVVAGEAVVADPAANRVHVLNVLATVAWSLMDGTRTAERVLVELREATECSDPRLETDLTALFARLEEDGLIEWPAVPAEVASYGLPLKVPAALKGAGYEAPRVVSTEKLEVIAAVCSSTRTGQGNPPGPGGGGPPGRPPGSCRTWGVCSTPFE